MGPMIPHPTSAGRRGRLLLELPLALLLATVGVYLVLRDRVGDGGLALLDDGQVLVRVDHLSGELTSEDRPGAHTFVPWLQEVHRLDRRPVRYVMGGGDDAVDLRAPALIVRGRDGSSFSFPRVEIHAVLDSERAEVALIDHGGERANAARLVDAYARPVLREAFGRATPREIVLPDAKQAAGNRAREELGAALARHGIRLLELSVSKPRFPQEYQETIQRRLVADQDTDRIVRERAELEASRAERLAEVRENGERALTDLRRELADQLADARRAAARTVAAATVAADERLAAATLERDEQVARANVETAHFRAEAAAFSVQLAELEEQGPLAVRAALVERLGSIRFEFTPAPREAADDRARRTSQGGTR